MNRDSPLSSHDRQARLIALAAEMRPALHRYCARLMGSVIDGEDETVGSVVVLRRGIAILHCAGLRQRAVRRRAENGEGQGVAVNVACREVDQDAAVFSQGHALIDRQRGGVARRHGD